MLGVYVIHYQITVTYDEGQSGLENCQFCQLFIYEASLSIWTGNEYVRSAHDIKPADDYNNWAICTPRLVGLQTKHVGGCQAHFGPVLNQ